MKWKQKLALKAFVRFFIKSKHRCFFWKRFCCFARPYVKKKVKSKVSKLSKHDNKTKKVKKKKNKVKKNSNKKDKKDYNKL